MFSLKSQTVMDPLVGLIRPIRFRGKGRLLEKLTPKRGERRAQVFDYRMRLDLSDLGQRWIYLGIYEQQETQLVKNWLRPGMTVVDVGANVGYHTLLAASRVGPGGRVFAVEPSPYAFERLRDTILNNPLSQVVALQVALGRSGGEASLYLPPSGNHSPTMVPCDREESVRVAVRTLDDCLAEWGVECVDLLKIDVEGYELEVLMGARSALGSGRVLAVLCEFNDYWLELKGTSARELAQFHDSADFSLAWADKSLSTSINRFYVHRSVEHRFAGPLNRQPH